MAAIACLLASDGDQILHFRHRRSEPGGRSSGRHVEFVPGLIVTISSLCRLERKRDADGSAAAYRRETFVLLAPCLVPKGLLLSAGWQGRSACRYHPCVTLNKDPDRRGLLTGWPSGHGSCAMFSQRLLSCRLLGRCQGPRCAELLGDTPQACARRSTPSSPSARWRGHPARGPQ